MLSVAIFLPIAGALVDRAAAARRGAAGEVVAAGFAAVVLAIVAFMFVDYDRDAAGYQFVNSTVWINSDVSDFELKYAVGLDGLSRRWCC